MTITMCGEKALATYVAEEFNGAGLDNEQVQELLQELDDYGIETVEQFEDAYAGCYESRFGSSAEANFSEELVSDCGYITDSRDLPSFIANHIDYQAIWDCELRHDYFTIEVDNSTYFFSAHF